MSYSLSSHSEKVTAIHIIFVLNVNGDRRPNRLKSLYEWPLVEAGQFVQLELPICRIHGFNASAIRVYLTSDINGFDIVIDVP